MSKVVPSDITIPAHLANAVGQPSKLSAALEGRLSAGVGYPQVLIKGARFRIVEDGIETVLDTTTLEVVIVGANPKLSKTYYAKAWDKGAEPTAPDCYSLDGIKPHPESAEPQNDICASCPHNAWDSKIGLQGQQLKACTDQKRLAIVAADNPDGPVYLLQATLASLANLRTYLKELSRKGIPLEVVRTVISFDDDGSGDAKLIFKFGRFLDENEYNLSKELFGSGRVHEVTGEQVTQKSAAYLQKNEKRTFIPTSETSLLSDDAPWELPELDEAGEDLADNSDALTAAQWLMMKYEPHEVISTYYSRVIDGTRNINILANSSAQLIEKLVAKLSPGGVFEGLVEKHLSNKFSKLKELIKEIGIIVHFDGQCHSGNEHIEDAFDAFEALERVSSLSKEIEKTLLETPPTFIIALSDLERMQSQEFRSIIDDLMLANAGIEVISYYFSMANDLNEETSGCIDKVMMIPGETLAEPSGEKQVSEEDKNYCEILERLADHGIDWSEATKAFEKLISWPKERWET